MFATESNRHRFRNSFKTEFNHLGVPYFEIDISGKIVDFILNRTNMPPISKLSPEQYLDFARKIGMDAVYITFTWNLGRVYGTLADGSKQYIDGCIKERHQLKNIPQPDFSNNFHRLEKLCELAPKMNIAVVVGIASPYKTLNTAIGYLDFCIKSIDDMSFLNEFDDIISQYLDKVLNKIIQYPIDALLIPGDVCAKNGTIVSPAFIQSFWLPRTKKFIAPAKSKNIPIIMHMDGDFSSIFNLILELGADAIHPFEMTGKLNIYDAKNQYGSQITLMGNIDCAGVLANGTPNAVKKDVREHIEALNCNGRYVCGSSHDVGDNIPVDNFMAMLETIHCSRAEIR